ncbi:cadherin domain-containing protein [Blastocystis sp. subtype 4]|uniref:cadherin domain-containing protein n=1 Tax=Blastocystis sp. subtype 4 TaxID=944170 RepID=UPI00071140AA|nr:cadherin domain-containing protein [Blastocystis sp. subtype 4]KNB41368.1 cadherin domain-containing protein [Blastocystis sp. subtype 4]|eukprot:XP_014524811.1 cadherin domain-containing protein [Blastocystis sp. subtype 4]
MDLDPYTTGFLPNTIGTYIEWTVENLIGSKWNSFNMVGGSTVTSWGFDIIATYDPDESASQRVTILSAIDQTVTQRTKPQIAVPVALAGFRRYRWEVTVTGTTGTTLGSVHMAYCKASGAVCPGIGNYPSVAEGQISPSSCETGYSGYSYRECSGGVLGEVKTDHCSMRPPTNARYISSMNRFVMGTQVTTGVPSVRNIVQRWYIDTGVVLPAGLSLNAQTGEISGIPTDTMDLTTYTVYAENESGATRATVSIQVRKGQCVAEGVFPVTDVGTVAEYDCATQGSYVGTQKRACVLGSEDGEWQKASGFCMSVPLLVIGVIIVIVIVAIVVLFLMRTGKKAKAVGGVKGKKSSKSSKTTTKKVSAKQVKV